MNVALVADVGNSLVKWGLCRADAVGDHVALAADDPAAWQQQSERWQLVPPLCWAVAGVHPPRRAALVDWLRQRGHQVWLVESYQQLPLTVQLAQPDGVGIDRLLNAVAVNQRRRPNAPAIVVDAGSAVTVDYVDAAGAFRGGAILPGLRLMARALHDYTALLPLIEVRRALREPGTSTAAAMELGVLHAVVGGITSLIQAYQTQGGAVVEVYLTGGDAAFLAPLLPPSVIPWPTMTLEGIRLAAAVSPRPSASTT